MQSAKILLALTCFSLLVMLVIDYFIGAQAEFLNAYSVLQRLIGQQPTFGNSMVAEKSGSTGEFLIVIITNISIAGVITYFVRLLKIL